MKQQMKDLLGGIIRGTNCVVIAASKKHTSLLTTPQASFRMGAAAVLLGCVCSTSIAQGTYIFVPSELVSGAMPNALPFTETFDKYPAGFGFATPTNGWLCALTDASRTVPSTVLPKDALGEPPLFSGNCLELGTEGNTLYNATTSQAQNVWIDMSVIMTPGELPSVVPGTQLGVALDCDYRLNVYSGLTNVFVPSGIQLATTWGQGLRLTLQIAYNDNLTVPYFRVFIDQTNVIWEAGYRLPDVPSECGGAWLPCATTNRTFNGLGFVDFGYVDALKFSDVNLGPVAPYQTGIKNAVAISWLSDYGQWYQVETSEDLASGEWQPFGEPVLGDGTTNTVFDAIGSVSCKFYRVTPL